MADKMKIIKKAKKAAGEIGSKIGDAVQETKNQASSAAEKVTGEAKKYSERAKESHNAIVKEKRPEKKETIKKNEMIFQSVESLQQVVNVVNEAAYALNDKSRTIRESAIPEVLAGALGAGIGGVGSFAALYGLGVVGLSAAGITSGLATAGAIVDGGMVAGVFVLAAPVAALAAGSVGVAVHLKNKQHYHLFYTHLTIFR